VIERYLKMRRLLVSITIGAFTALALSWIGRLGSTAEFLTSFPGIIFAVVIPSIHSGWFMKAALLYNLVIYSLVIYWFWGKFRRRSTELH